MRLPIIIALVALSLSAAPVAPAASTPPGELHTFYGEIKSIDLPGKTMTIKSAGRTLLFHYTDSTKISSPHEYVRWDKVKPGQVATVVMRLGDGNQGIAVLVRFDDGPASTEFLSLFSARTLRGETVSGLAVNNFVAHEPPAERFSRAINLGRRHVGLFLLSVRGDGGVGTVRSLQSLGVAELDARAAKWLQKWRFRPQSVTEVRMPVVSTQSY